MSKDLTMADGLDFLLKSAPDWFRKQIHTNYSHGVALTEEEVLQNGDKMEKWINPLEVALPYAPDTKIFCT